MDTPSTAVPQRTSLPPIQGRKAKRGSQVLPADLLPPLSKSQPNSPTSRGSSKVKSKPNPTPPEGLKTPGLPSTTPLPEKIDPGAGLGIGVSPISTAAVPSMDADATPLAQEPAEPGPSRHSASSEENPEEEDAVVIESSAVQKALDKRLSSKQMKVAASFEIAIRTYWPKPYNRIPTGGFPR